MKTLVTPSIAKELLHNNSNNRQVNQSNISFLAEEILNDRFRYNGESIIVSISGNLLDGQHRLMAVVKANKEVHMNIVKDVDDETVGTIDTGAARTAGNVLHMHDIVNSNNVASTIKRILEKIGTERRMIERKAVKISNFEILEFYKLHSELLQKMTLFCSSLHNTNVKIMTISLMASYLYLLSLEDKRAKNFIREVLTD